MTLTEKQLQELTQAIHRRRNALETELDEDVARGAEALPEEIADAARDVTELHALEDAAARLAEGTYGTCIDCGALIPYERLTAAPEAARCIDCQGRREHAHPAPRPRL